MAYKYGGNGKNGIDCSQLLVSFGQAAGLIKGDMTAASMFQQPAQNVPLDQLKQGDLVYYRNDKGITHVGIAM